VAQADLQLIVDGAGRAGPGNMNVPAAVSLKAWRALPPGRRKNVLRHWLQLRVGQGAAESLLARLMSELASDKPARWPAGAFEVRRYRGLLHCERVEEALTDGKYEDATSDSSAQVVARVATQVPARVATKVAATLGPLRAGTHPVPTWGGTLTLTAARQEGLSPERLEQCELRPRTGGEQFQLEPGSTPRSLKKQFQALGVPAWQRAGPLLYGAGVLLYVPGLGVDARVLAPPGAPQLQVHWAPG
jgi:tRNA(Ile)-lysidine synthase